VAETPLDAERILRALAEHSVDYVIVGGLAVQTHGHVRTTIDVDILPRPDPVNLARLADVLNALHARVVNPGSEGIAIDVAMLPRATLWQFETRHGAVDVLHEAPGAPSYDELCARALEIRLGDLTVAGQRAARRPRRPRRARRDGGRRQEGQEEQEIGHPPGSPGAKPLRVARPHPGRSAERILCRDESSTCGGLDICSGIGYVVLVGGVL
jgi:hypothetical protein